MVVSELASWPAGTPQTPGGWAPVIISAGPPVQAPSPCPADSSSLLLLQSLENLILTLSVPRSAHLPHTRGEARRRAGTGASRLAKLAS